MTLSKAIILAITAFTVSCSPSPVMDYTVVFGAAPIKGTCSSLESMAISAYQKRHPDVPKNHYLAGFDFGRLGYSREEAASLECELYEGEGGLGFVLKGKDGTKRDIALYPLWEKLTP